MEKIATDIYTFSKLRDNSFIYVDKTDASQLPHPSTFNFELSTLN